MFNPKNAEKMLRECRAALEKGEYNLRTLRGVHMSVSDVETAILYGETIIRCGTYRDELMKPRCEVRDLLEKFQLIDE